jgi:eukaryotic-like serine/threonine-protein kinase
MTSPSPAACVIGRYALFDEIARGGMATIHIGRLVGSAGFSRTVAIKRLHPNYAHDQEFVAMFMDEARLAGRIRHPNVVSTMDVVQHADELFLVMEFIQGESLSWLSKAAIRKGVRIPIPIATTAMAGALFGLHAAHEATNEQGEILNLVHRDVSPHNILIGTDGVPRVIDFGVAKAKNRLQKTYDGQVKGKLSYMAPEQLRGNVDRRTDVYAAAVCLWELLTGQKLFEGNNDAQLMLRLLEGNSVPPSAVEPSVPKALDDVVMCGLHPDKEQRFRTAHDMGMAIESAVRSVTARQLAEWLTYAAGRRIGLRGQRIAEIEGYSIESILENAQAVPSSSNHLPLSGSEGDPASIAASIAVGGTNPSGVVPVSEPNPYSLGPNSLLPSVPPGASSQANMQAGVPSPSSLPPSSGQPNSIHPHSGQPNSVPPHSGQPNSIHPNSNPSSNPTSLPPTQSSPKPMSTKNKVLLGFIIFVVALILLAIGSLGTLVLTRRMLPNNKHTPSRFINKLTAIRHGFLFHVNRKRDNEITRLGTSKFLPYLTEFTPNHLSKVLRPPRSYVGDAKPSKRGFW